MKWPVLYDCWSNNYVRRDDGYVGHVWMEANPRQNRTLCGVPIQEIGERLITRKEEIGCRRCKRSRFLKQ